MNNTTTYKRSMFGLTEINADTINANNLVLSGPLKVNSITSTAAGQSLSIDALGTGTLSLKSNGVTKMSASNTTTDFYSNTTTIREGKQLQFYDGSNTLKGYMNAASFGQIYNSNAALHYFQISGSNRLILGLGLNQLLVPTTVATEAVGSNNTRVATTEFVTTATLGLTGITYSNIGSIDMTTITNNVTIGAGKIFSLPNFSDVETELTNINTTLTGISYDADSYATLFGTNVVIDNVLSIIGYSNVKLTLDNLVTSYVGITGITYTSGTDTTLISNNLTIGTGKILSIPNFSNIESTLTTLTTNATGITYSAPYPLFIPQTTIAHDLYLATNKKLICDQSWIKLYTTHDLTDSVGVGYFKGFMYNNGSVFTLSTINPIDVYDGTSSEIVLKCGTQETIFGIDGMSLNWGTITLCTDIQLPDYASLTTTLDNFTTEITDIKATFNETIYTDDFIDGFSGNPILWTSGGTGAVGQIDDEIGYQGMIRMVASNDRLLYPTSASNIFYWDGTNRMDFFIRVNFTDTNTYFGAGLSDNSVGTGNSIIWDYQNGVGWGAYVNGTLASISSITMTTGDWLYGSIINTHTGTKAPRFYLKNVTTGQTHDLSYANIPAISLTAKYRPYFRVKNTSGGGGKSMDIDYTSINYISSRPVTPA